jgi:hypothetical protein
MQKSHLTQRVFIVLAVVVVAAQDILFNQRHQVSQAHQQTSAITSAKINVMVDRQDSEVINQDQLSPQFLANHEAYTVERIRTKRSDYFKSRSQPVPEIRMRSKSNYIEMQGRKLGIVRVFEHELSNSVVVFGIVGRELVRVMFGTQSTTQIELTHGVCGEKLEEVFGISFFD